MNKKTGQGLVNFARSCLARGDRYLYGTYGNRVCTLSLIEAKRLQFKDDGQSPFFTNGNDGQNYAELCKQYSLGHIVADCSGGIKSYIWLDEATGKITYTPATDFSANGLYRNFCSEKGKMDSFPKELVGALVFHVNSAGRYTHVGISEGDGNVLEWRGVKYGLVRTKLEDRGWDTWGKCSLLSYEDASATLDIDYEVTCTALNVRKGAGTSFRILRSVPKGTILHVTEFKGDWGKHQFGWSNVSTAFCKKVGADVADPEVDFSKYPSIRVPVKPANPYAKMIQTELMKKGYKLPRYGADGVISVGGETEKAMVAFLKSVGLISKYRTTMKGITWGQKCWTALYS